MVREVLDTCLGDLIKCRSVEENSDKVKFTVELQIFENYYYLEILFLVPCFTSQVVQIFLKICELRNIGAFVLLVLVPQVLVASLVLGCL